jgi:hypothetical protein
MQGDVPTRRGSRSRRLRAQHSVRTYASTGITSDSGALCLRVTAIVRPSGSGLPDFQSPRVSIRWHDRLGASSRFLRDPSRVSLATRILPTSGTSALGLGTVSAEGYLAGSAAGQAEHKQYVSAGSTSVRGRPSMPWSAAPGPRLRSPAHQGRARSLCTVGLAIERPPSTRRADGSQCWRDRRRGRQPIRPRGVGVAQRIRRDMTRLGSEGGEAAEIGQASLSEYRVRDGRRHSKSPPRSCSVPHGRVDRGGWWMISGGPR